jgi:AAA+ ATPase superfamily predicted ATPase
VASSKTSRPEIEGVIGQSVGPQIEKLETEFGLLKRIIPIFSKPGTRQIKYKIEDNFLNFWFRFIYKYRSAIEIRNFKYVRDIVERDYSIYIGRILEKYFQEKLILTGNYSEIGTYWEKSNLNEIDLVALNEDKKIMLLGEVKLNPKAIRLGELEAKSLNIAASHREYKIIYQGFSVRDM